MNISSAPRFLSATRRRYQTARLIAISISLVADLAVAGAEPANLGTLKTELKAYHASAYSADLTAALADAEQWIRKRAAKVKRPAIVLDIDETALSNWEEIEANDFAYLSGGDCAYPPKLPCGSQAWDKSARAKAIESTLKLYQLAVQLKVGVFFVTGRLEDPDERAATELNLWKEGYRGWQQVMMRPDMAGSVVTYKTNARAAIEASGYTVIANIGDQKSDLDGGHAERIFKVPNPFYYIP